MAEGQQIIVVGQRKSGGGGGGFGAVCSERWYIDDRRSTQ